MDRKTEKAYAAAYERLTASSMVLNDFLMDGDNEMDPADETYMLWLHAVLTTLMPQVNPKNIDRKSLERNIRNSTKWIGEYSGTADSLLKSGKRWTR